MKAVIYSRTAKRVPTHRPNSTRTQISICRKYAKEKNFEVSGVFADAGYSGATLNRPALNKMRRIVVRNSIDAVIVSDFSRLTRSATDRSTLEKEFAQYGVVLHAVLNHTRERIVKLVLARPRK